MMHIAKINSSYEIQQGMAYYLSHQFEKSLVSYRQALTVQKFCTNEEGKDEIKSAKLWNNIGCVQFELLLLDEAKVRL